MGLPDSMLLTLPTPAKTEFDFKSPHDFLPHTSSFPRPISPRLESSSSRDLPLPPPAGNHISNMSQPPPRLPPGSITLPDPRLPPPIGVQSHGGLPNPPSQWQGAEDSMRNWLLAKAEEERRKQEEERTRQESLKLEQRKIEQSMLQDAIRHNVPASLLPLIFAGIGGSGPNAVSVDWLNQYVSQLAAQQQQQQQASSPDLRRGERALGQPVQGQYPVQPPPLGQPPGAGPVPGFAPYQPGAGSPASAARSAGPASAGPTSAPRGQFVSVLPRLATADAGQAPGQHIQSSVVQSAQSEQASPGLYFHHWTPPSSQAGGGGSGGGGSGGGGSQNPAPSTPAGKRQK
jgi:hypothetical protein